MDYHLLWHGDVTEDLPAHVQVKPLSGAPSLMYLCDLPNTPPCAVVLDFRAGCPYSVPHVLSTAKLLSTTPHRFFVLPGKDFPEALANCREIIKLPESVPEALLAISKSMQAPDCTVDSGKNKKHKPEKKQTVPVEPQRSRPALELYGMVLILAVAGAQSRIGCTTQAFCIWHYCKNLGLQPAVVMAPDTAELMAKYMDGKPRDGGFQIGGIPVVDGMTYEFDCYIQDLGVLTPDNLRRFLDADCGVFVMGGKPWELPFAARALPIAEGQERLLLLVSFCTNATLAELQKLFPDQRMAAAEWCPDPFQTQTPDFDAALQPLLERAILPDFP